MQLLIKNDAYRSDTASKWLSEQRGFVSPRRIIGSGFSNLDAEDINLFGPTHINFLKQRLKLGQHLVVPIRGAHSPEVENLFFRAIFDVQKQDKSRLLTGAGGWSCEDKTPRAFGFPELIHEYPNLVICEGMADYFAARISTVWRRKYLPLGAPNASSLPRWAEWLKETKYQGRVIWIYQLDVNKQGEILATETGQRCAIAASKF